MKSEWSVSLSGIKIRAFHGIHDFERKTGNDFLVDVRLKLSGNPEEIAELKSTVDYQAIYQIVVEEMEVASELLEEVVSRITDRILAKHSNVEWTEVSLSKLNPPGMENCEAAKVTLKRKAN